MECGIKYPYEKLFKKKNKRRFKPYYKGAKNKQTNNKQSKYKNPQQNKNKQRKKSVVFSYLIFIIFVCLFVFCFCFFKQQLIFIVYQCVKNCFFLFKKKIIKNNIASLYIFERSWVNAIVSLWGLCYHGYALHK